MCDILSYENIFNIYVSNYDIIIRVLNFLNIILGNPADALMCEMDRFRILDPLKSQCAASAASLMYILTNNGYPEPTNILRPEIIPPVKNINNIVGSVFNENPFDGLNPTKPYIFYLNVNSNNSSIIGGNFTGHVSNLIYIPHPVLASASNLETIKFGKFYCIQSFIYLYNTQIKELSYDEFKKYIKIYLHRFNTSNPENFRALSYDRINVIEYLTVTWANNNDYYGNRLHGPVLDTRISVYEINNINTVLSRLIKIIGYQHTYFKVILKYLNTYYKISNYYSTGARMFSNLPTAYHPFCIDNIRNNLYYNFININDYNISLFNRINPAVERLKTSFGIKINSNLVTDIGSNGLSLIDMMSREIVNTNEYFRKNIIKTRKFSEDTVDCLHEIIKIFDKDIKKYIFHFNKERDNIIRILVSKIQQKIEHLRLTNYFDFLVIIGLIDIFKLRYYERFNFVGNPQPYEPSTTNPENYYLTNDFIDIFIKLKLSSVCSSMPETHKLESWAYQIYVIAYIILKIFFPAIHNDPDFGPIEALINRDITQESLIRPERYRIESDVLEPSPIGPVSRSLSTPIKILAHEQKKSKRPSGLKVELPPVQQAVQQESEVNIATPVVAKRDMEELPVRPNTPPIRRRVDPYGGLGGNRHFIKYKFNNNILF